MSESAPVVRLRRTVAATPHRVYRAWLEPDLLRTWSSVLDLLVGAAPEVSNG